VSSFVAIWAAAGLVDAVNRLPLIGGLLEGVGLVVTSWFVYRNLIFGPDRSAIYPSVWTGFAAVIGAILVMSSVNPVSP
jgi:hypothetical protein